MLNRRAIQDAIEHEMAASGRAGGGFAVLVLDAGDLRDFATRFGSDRGEQAEASVARLIRGALRPCDVVHQSGDETFVAVLPGLRGPDHALLAVAGLLATFEQPHIIAADTPPLNLRVAMGIALFPRDGGDADALWRNAHAAAADARRGSQRYAFHDDARARPSIDYHDLHDAIESNRLEAWFQPIRQLASSRIAGVESLARWTSATLGPVSPEDFVPFAERDGLIPALTRWSIHATLRHAAALHGAYPCRFAVNLSPRAFTRGGTVEQILDALAIWGVPPGAIIAEVTETALASDMDAAVDALRRLRDRGMLVSIDDFGIGYGSITYLSRFPATGLKIDKSLVRSLGSDPRMARLVESIIRFAHNLDLETTAEGIEDEPTRRMLLDMGCEFGQGHHLGRPEPAADLIRLLLENPDC